MGSYIRAASPAHRPHSAPDPPLFQDGRRWMSIGRSVRISGVHWWTGGVWGGRRTNPAPSSRRNHSTVASRFGSGDRVESGGRRLRFFSDISVGQKGEKIFRRKWKWNFTDGQNAFPISQLAPDRLVPFRNIFDLPLSFFTAGQFFKFKSWNIRDIGRFRLKGNFKFNCLLIELNLRPVVHQFKVNRVQHFHQHFNVFFGDVSTL